MNGKKELRKRGLISTGYHLPYNPRLRERARDLRKHMTVAESRLWKGFLQRLPYTILRQKPLDNYVVDFYCAKAKLVIELDGEIHRTPNARAYDEERDAVLGGYGLTVMRFTNEMVKDNFSTVCAQIRRVIEERIPLDPPLIKGEGSSGRPGPGNRKRV